MNNLLYGVPFQSFMIRAISLRALINKGTPTGPINGRYTATLCSSGKYTCPTILFSKNAFSA